MLVGIARLEEETELRKALITRLFHNNIFVKSFQNLI